MEAPHRGDLSSPLSVPQQSVGLVITRVIYTYYSFVVVVVLPAVIALVLTLAVVVQPRLVHPWGSTFALSQVCNSVSIADISSLRQPSIDADRGLKRSCSFCWLLHCRPRASTGDWGDLIKSCSNHSWFPPFWGRCSRPVVPFIVIVLAGGGCCLRHCRRLPKGGE